MFGTLIAQSLHTVQNLHGYLVTELRTGCRNLIIPIFNHLRDSIPALSLNREGLLFLPITPGNVKLWESTGKAGGLPVIN